MAIAHCPHCKQPILLLDILGLDGIEALLLAHQDGDGWGEYGEGRDYDVAGLGVVRLVDSEGGGEGGGSHVSRVFRVNGRYFRKTGYYASYDGTTWDGPLTEVRPTEKLVTFYE